MAELIKGLVILPGVEGVVEITIDPDNQLRDMQSAVNGYIEFITATRFTESVLKNYDVYCNEEGRLLGMDVTLDFDTFNLVGPILVVRGNDETGEIETLTEEDIELISNDIQRYRININKEIEDVLGVEQYN